MSSGREASVWLSALSISSALPSKKRPQPDGNTVNTAHAQDGFHDELTTNEERVAGEDGTLVSILEQIADAILSVARSVQGLHLDTFANRESVAMFGSLGDFVAVSAADDWQRVALEDLGVSASMVVVAEE